MIPSLAVAGLVLTWVLLSSAQTKETVQVVSAPRSLIIKPLDESRLTTLKGDTHPLARPIYDVGTAPATLPMERMLLVLKRSPDQETTLRRLLDAQQDRHAPGYHKWLTPEEFGKRFGPSYDDIQKITAWLQSHGFRVGTTKGRTILEFSGSASQVQEAFHTTIHKYVVNGEQHWANASDPMIPEALIPAVAGVLTLHNFAKKPSLHWTQQPASFKVSQKGARPQVTFPASGSQPAVNALGPQDFATIYNSTSVMTFPGTAISIGAVGRSNLFDQSGAGTDVNQFTSLFGLGSISPTIVLNGPDPGDLGGAEEAEATLDTTWSQAVAPSALVYFVVSATTNTTDGVDLSALYIVENNLTDIMTESFSLCEGFANSSQIAGQNALAEQAAAQGITYFVSTGDSGAEECDDPSAPPATHPISVNYLASTQFNVAVGGTMFNEHGSDATYWGSEPPVQESAISYIPEDVWNESSLSNGLWATGGGASTINRKPNWQSGTGLNIPQDNARDLPDVSLTAASHDPYLLCYEGSCGQNHIYFISGTSASTPAFAGIMGLIEGYLANLNPSQGHRQGQANYQFYALAASQSSTLSQCDGSNTAGLPAGRCIFNDVTVGNNVVPGETVNSYQAGTGYDQATGLGSVNVTNLVQNWSNVTFNATSTALTPSGTTTITHGQGLNFTATVSPSSGTGPTATGDVVLLTGNNVATQNQSTLEIFSLSNGQVTGTTSNLPGGSTVNLWAHYGGDSTYAASDSNMLSVIVNPENSTTSLATFDQTGNPIAPGSTLPFGSTVFVRADVVGLSGKGVPTGTVNFTDAMGPLPGSILSPVVNPSPLNSQGNTSIGGGIVNFDAGDHSISGSYSGDSSFNPSISPAPVTFGISPGFAMVSGPTDVVIASPGSSGTSNVGIISSTGFSAAINLTCAGLPAEATCSANAVSGTGPNAASTATVTVTTTAAHTTMLRSKERRVYLAAVLGVFPVVTLFLLTAPRRRRNALLGLMLLGLLVVAPSCGGGGGSSGGGPHQAPALRRVPTE